MAWAAKQSGAASAANGLMHLPSQNSILLTALAPRLGFDALREPCELKISDFDDVIYKLFVPPEVGLAEGGGLERSDSRQHTTNHHN